MKNKKPHITIFKQKYRNWYSMIYKKAYNRGYRNGYKRNKKNKAVLKYNAKKACTSRLLQLKNTEHKLKIFRDIKTILSNYHINTSLEDICSSSRKISLVNIRVIICHELRVLGYSLEKIGIALNRKHCSVLYLLNRKVK